MSHDNEHRDAGLQLEEAKKITLKSLMICVLAEMQDILATVKEIKENLNANKR